MTDPFPPTSPAELIEFADLGVGKGPVYSQAWSADGRFLATADPGLIHVWELATLTEAALLEGHAAFVWGLAFSPDGSLLASVSQDGSLRLWDISSHTPGAVLEAGWAFCVVWSPDGGRLAVGTQRGEVQIWEVAARHKLGAWKGRASSAIRSLSWSPERLPGGQTLAAGEANGRLTFWDAGSGRRRLQIAGISDERCDVNGLAWSPDGELLASAHQDGRLRLWQADSGALQGEIYAHQGWGRGLAWSPDGRRLASGGQDKRVCVWDASSGTKIAEQQHNFLPVWSVGWSPDGRLVSSGAGAYDQPHTGATILWKMP